jgi:hypothetical protein
MKYIAGLPAGSPIASDLSVLSCTDADSRTVGSIMMTAASILQPFSSQEALIDLFGRSEIDVGALRSNCRVWMFFSGRSPAFLKELESLMGEAESPYSHGTRPLLSVQDLQHMEPGTALVLNDRCRPKVCRLPDIDGYDFGKEWRMEVSVLPVNAPLPKRTAWSFESRCMVRAEQRASAICMASGQGGPVRPAEPWDQPARIPASGDDFLGYIVSCDPDHPDAAKYEDWIRALRSHAESQEEEEQDCLPDGLVDDSWRPDLPPKDDEDDYDRE